MLTPPQDPESGEDILTWARAITRVLRQIIPRPGPEIWPSIGSTGTSYLLRRKKKGGESEDSASVCELGIFEASTDESKKIGVRWGRINGRQPTGFNTRGLISPFTITETTYFYASATCDLATLIWTSAAVIQSENPVLPNTSTIAYRMIGVAEFVAGEEGGDDKLIVTPTCGAVDFDICELSHF